LEKEQRGSAVPRTAASSALYTRQSVSEGAVCESVSMLVPMETAASMAGK